MAIIEQPPEPLAFRGSATRVTPDAAYGVFRRPVATTGWRSWLFTIDHKKIGIMYGVTALFFFVVGGIEALLIRLQLAQPDGKLLSAEHLQPDVHHARHDDGLPRRHADGGRLRATTCVPLQIGARDVAFPRLNSFGFWAFFFGGVFLNLSLVHGRRAGRRLVRATRPTPAWPSRPPTAWTSGSWPCRSPAWPR